MSPAQSIPAATPERILQRLDWQVIRRLDGLLQGDYRTLFYGAGIDFTDLREYQPQDDIRHIDWNVTARMDSPYVRQYVEDRDLTAWFLLDRSPSMGFGPADRSKGAVLTDFVGVLARLLTRKGNRVGAILYNNQLDQIIPPRSSRDQVLRLIRVLQEAPVKRLGETTNLKELLVAGLHLIRRRSLVFVISDFFSQPDWEGPLSMLARRNEVIAVRLWDPREVELPDAGLIVVEDAETGEQLFVDTSSPAFRSRFIAQAEAHEKSLQEALRKTGVDLFAISTAEDLVRAVTRMAALRKKRRR